MKLTFGLSNCRIINAVKNNHCLIYCGFISVVFRTYVGQLQSVIFRLAVNGANSVRIDQSGPYYTSSNKLFQFQKSAGRDRVGNDPEVWAILIMCVYIKLKVYNAQACSVVSFTSRFLRLPSRIIIFDFLVGD